MQNYWNRCDWLTQAYPFKHVGTYESEILVDFMNNPDTLASLSALSHSGDLLYYYRSKPSRRNWRNFMKERGVSHTAILGHVGKLMCSPLGAPQHSPSVSSYYFGVRDRPPRCLISYIVRETAGRGCRQLTWGWRGRISCDFWVGGGVCGLGYIQISCPMLQGLIWYMQSQYKICSELFLKRKTTVSVRFSSLTPSFTEILSNSPTARVCNISHRL